MRSLTDLVLPAAASLLLLGLLIGLQVYPPLIETTQFQEMVLAIGLAAVAHCVAAILGSRVLRNADHSLRRAVMIAGILFVAFVGTYTALFVTLTEIPQGTSTRLPIGLAYSTRFLEVLSLNNDDSVVT